MVNEKNNANAKKTSAVMKIAVLATSALSVDKVPLYASSEGQHVIRGREYAH